ncbi:FG-GAP-like repeat-containing protein, partial [Desulfocurvibacter africanus]|uniref:FG-GAP-like repeat-containing protein n=1 Tax=Desulfocurvibacter africanus TaxID=873 RepID=UPI000481F05C
MDARMPTRVRLLALVFIVLLGLRPEARLEAATAVAFGPQQIISTDALGANSVHAADLDGDGDLDVLSAS